MDHHLRLHEKYGSLVRVGPNHVSFSDASLIQQVYGITTKFYKVGRGRTGHCCTTLRCSPQTAERFLQAV